MGENRRFIRCDQFPATRNHFLRHLSNISGALDNAESPLDTQEPSAREVSADADKLARFANICICITSRVSPIPPSCETFEIATLSAEVAHDTFYRIYEHTERPAEPINDILKQLDFHPLSIVLLATVAQYNKWGADRVTTELERQQTGVLHLQHFGILATTIELSLA